MKLPFTPSQAALVILPLELPRADLERRLALLSDEERARAFRFHFERDRDHFIAARGGLREILGACLEVPPADLTFGLGPRGKPFVKWPPASELRFNLSHSHSFALVGLSLEREIGVDLEYLRPVHDAHGLSKRYYTPNEAAFLETLSGDALSQAFLRGWTRKEAFIKALGQGLYFSLDRFEVTLGLPAALIQVDGDPARAQDFTVVDLQDVPGYVGALVLEGPLEDLIRL